MCISPISILNPNFRQGSLGFNRFKNTTDKYIQVPCGNCPQCLSLRQEYFNQTVLLELLNRDLYYGMLSIQPSMMEYTNVGEYHVKKLPWHTLQLALRRLRSMPKYKDLRYLVVGEYGGETHRPHFHFIISLPKAKDNYSRLIVHNDLFRDVLKNWSKNVGSHRVPVYKDMLRYVNKNGHFNYHCDFVDTTPLRKFGLSFYFSKYMFKADDYIRKLLQKISLDDSLSRDEQLSLIRDLKPRYIKSPKFGSIESDIQKQHLQKCIDVSLSPQYIKLPFQWIDPFTGQISPMSPTIRKKIVTIDHLQYKYDHTDHLPLSFSFDNPKDLVELHGNYLEFLKQKRYLQKTKQKVLYRSSTDDLI